MAELSRVSISDEKPLHMRLLSFPLMGYARTPFQSQTRSRSTCDGGSEKGNASCQSVSISDEKPLHMRRCESTSLTWRIDGFNLRREAAPHATPNRSL